MPPDFLEFACPVSFFSCVFCVVGYLVGTIKSRKIAKKLAAIGYSKVEQEAILSSDALDSGIDDLAMRNLIHHADIRVGALVVWMLKFVLAATIAIAVIIGPIVLLGGVLFFG